jgi:3-dehydroquinate synthase
MKPITVDVALAERSYPITIGSHLLDDPAHYATALRGRHVLVVTDGNVGPRYAARVLAALGERSSAVATIEPGEQSKTMATLAGVLDRLAALRASRDATVVALGGGVVGDLAGFAAACWMRGVGFVQVPTTLLAMVDSSVGGKTGVNLAAGKNLVGAFHQPRAVIADLDTLDTLPDRELRAGLAEVVKYAAIGDAAFADWIDTHAEALLARERDALAHAVATSVRHKAAIVARDEREDGERALLNLGHTFGHALESAGAYARHLHGEAVAIGMIVAAHLSARLGLAPATDAYRLAAMLHRLGLPTTVPSDFEPADLLERMRLDKKATSGRLRLILGHGLGKAAIVDGVADDDILAVLADCRD